MSSEIWVILERPPAVRVDLVNTNSFLFSGQDLESKPDTEMQTACQEVPVTRKRSAETDAERLEEDSVEIAEADADKSIVLKRKVENDPSGSEVEDSAMNLLAKLWVASGR